MAKTIDDYLKEITTVAGGRDLSVRWYRDQIRQIVPKQLTEAQTVMNIRTSANRTVRPTYGVMNLYFYSPKHEETLPYYDVFPLVIPIKKLKDGFIGINFHYLSVPLRIKLFEKLQPLAVENRRLGWIRVSKFRGVKPCVKRYLASHVKTRFAKITDEEMQVAMLMPVQRFKKQGSLFKETKVWADSRKNL